MTLNLIVMSPLRVYQCSDFRLTYANGSQTDHEAQKIVPISTFNWTALVQFTGVAKNSRGFDTCAWLADLAGRVKPDYPLKWLTDELLGAGRKIGVSDDHTFSGAGFEGEKPFVLVVSNFQGVPDMRSKSAVRQWRVSRASGRHGAFATGCVQYVTAEELRALRGHARRLPPTRVLERLSELNRLAAEKSGASGPISESCFAGYLSRNGDGGLVPYGVNPGEEYLPRFALNMLHVDRPERIKAKHDSNGNPIPRRLVQISLKRASDHRFFGSLAEFCCETIEFDQPRA
jgi:hypothetical protein